MKPESRREFEYAAAVYGSVLVTALVGAAREWVRARCPARVRLGRCLLARHCAELAMIAAVLQLAAWSFAAGWRTQHLVPSSVTGAVDCAFGLAIVPLEGAIH